MKRLLNVFLLFIVTLTLLASPLLAYDEYYYYDGDFDYYNDDYYDGDFGYYSDDYYEDDYEGSDGSSKIIISVIAGFAVSLVIVLIMKSQMTTVRAAENAANYVVSGSLHLRSQSDRYLYSNTVRTPRNTGNSGGKRK